MSFHANFQSNALNTFDLIKVSYPESRFLSNGIFWQMMHKQMTNTYWEKIVMSLWDNYFLKTFAKECIWISAEIMFAGHDFNKWNMADVFIWLYVYLYHLWLNMSIICLSFVFRQLGTNLVIPGGSKTIEVKGKLIMPGKKKYLHILNLIKKRCFS